MNIHKRVTSGMFFNRKADQSIEPPCEDIELWIRNHTLSTLGNDTLNQTLLKKQLCNIPMCAAAWSLDWKRRPQTRQLMQSSVALTGRWRANRTTLHLECFYMPPKANLWRKWCDLGIYADTINDRTESYLWFTCTSYKPYLEIKGIRTYAPYLLYVWFVPAL